MYEIKFRGKSKETGEWVERLVNWQPISTAPKTGRQKILLKTPYSPDGVIAYSNTWWVGGFSIECKPTHWAPAP
jgi:hypothetical protein